MFNYNNALSHEEIKRYSRHLILPEIIGQKGQLTLKRKRIVIIGAGGLGNVACCYLASVGVGHITIIDHDTIELSNLNRQIIYTVNDINSNKADKMKNHINSLNPLIDISVIIKKINYENALELLVGYDVAVDCTDNLVSRYCINDACAHFKIPLVFGSALGFDGQLSVYGYKGGPCLRCIYPTPPPVELVGSCNDNGILGPIVGIIGSMQALETIKVLLDLKDVLSSKLLIFDGLMFRPRVIKLRGKVALCRACVIETPFKELAILPAYCELYRSLDSNAEIDVHEYCEMLKNKVDHVLIDVRPAAQYWCSHFSHSINIPLINLQANTSEEIHEALIGHTKGNVIKTICVICRRGRSSRIATDHLLKLKDFSEKYAIQHIYDIKGGFQSWFQNIDPKYPYF